MKKTVEQVVKVEKSFCNICEKEIKKLPFDDTRLKIVRGLGKTKDFDAHEICLNKIIRAALQDYF